MLTALDVDRYARRTAAHQTIGNAVYQFADERGFEGGEGVVVPLIRAADAAEFMLKSYHRPNAERRRRIQFLSALRLGDLPGLPAPWFAAAPQEIVETKLLIDRGGGGPVEVSVEGYLAPRLRGDTLERRMLGKIPWDPPIGERVAIADGICQAVEVLEGAGIVHGDLSLTNVVVGASGSEPRLIDFDGFYHPGVPAIPSDAGRTWGTPGFRSARYRMAHSLVTSDRVALAALVFEIVVRRSADEVGNAILDQSAIDEGKIEAAAEIVARWPSGWAGVVEAFSGEPEKAPSPAEWRIQLDHHAAVARPLTLTLSDAGSRRSTHEIVEQAGSLGAVHVRFHWLSFARDRGSLKLSGVIPERPWFAQIEHANGTAGSIRGPGVELKLGRGDTLHWGGLSLGLDIDERREDR